MQTFISRKAQISTIIITQNAFQPSKYGKSIRRQQTYNILFHSFGDLGGISTMSRQFFPESPNLLQKCLNMLCEETDNNYEHYLLIDTHPKSPFTAKMRIRSNILCKKYP